jgi:hypothetical protein
VYLQFLKISLNFNTLVSVYSVLIYAFYTPVMKTLHNSACNCAEVDKKKADPNAHCPRAELDN